MINGSIFYFDDSGIVFTLSPCADSAHSMDSTEYIRMHTMLILHSTESTH